MAGLVVNVCVYSESNKRTVFPWTIVAVEDELQSFTNFFLVVIEPRIARSSTEIDLVYTLESAHVGSSRDRLDRVDLGLRVCQVVDTFGRYLKYVVISPEPESINVATAAVTSSSCANAFDIMMDSARMLGSQTLPNTVNEKNRKDKHYNDLLAMLHSKELKMKSKEVGSIGVKLMHVLRDVLWHIDGHHDTISKRSIPIPGIFQRFVGYNLPEAQKA